jgi:general secretion pathway protein G
MLKGCLQSYFLDMKTFPTTEQGLAALVAAPSGGEEVTGTDTVAATSNWGGPYTESGELPTDPWGNQYQYAYPPTNSKGDIPDIWSMGPDGQDNTEDDICSWTREGGQAGTEGDYSEYDQYQDAPPPAQP